MAFQAPSYAQQAVPVYNPGDWYRTSSNYAHSSTCADDSHPKAPRHLETPRGNWSSLPQGYVPPPPPGPPPRDAHLARMHSVIREIAMPEAHNSASMGLPFRQMPRNQAPLPLKRRELAMAAPKVPVYSAPHNKLHFNAPVPALKSPPLGRQHKPTPIDIGLAEGMLASKENRPAKTAPLRQFAIASAEYEPNVQGPPCFNSRELQFPKTAGLPPLRTNNGSATASVQGLSLSPLDTQDTPRSRKSLMVDCLLSPSLMQFVSSTESPVLQGSSESASPSLWSPQTPRAMAFDTNVVINDVTPPMSNHQWSHDRPQTIIEDDIQQETPLETAPPRGRIVGVQPCSISQQRARARSMSPPASAYPKESAFSWDTVDIGSRHVTDDDLYSITPVEPMQMMEDMAYKPVLSGFDARQTILGSYFKR